MCSMGRPGSVNNPIYFVSQRWSHVGLHSDMHCCARPTLLLTIMHATAAFPGDNSQFFAEARFFVGVPPRETEGGQLSPPS